MGDDSDTVSFVFEGENDDRISDFSLKLLDIESEQLGIPEGMQYPVAVKMPAAEFMKICRDLKEFGDAIKIGCTKDGLKFSVEGDIGVGNVMVKPRDADKEHGAALDRQRPAPRGGVHAGRGGGGELEVLL